MATLPLGDRQKIWRGLMRYSSRNLQGISVTKADLQAAVDAADSWVDSNSASFNLALPEPFRSSATATQKALLICVVTAMRFNLDFLTRLLGGVD